MVALFLNRPDEPPEITQCFGHDSAAAREAAPATTVTGKASYHCMSSSVADTPVIAAFSTRVREPAGAALRPENSDIDIARAEIYLEQSRQCL